MFVCLSVYLSVCMSICLFVCLYICMAVCLSVSLSYAYTKWSYIYFYLFFTTTTTTLMDTCTHSNGDADTHIMEADNGYIVGEAPILSPLAGVLVIFCLRFYLSICFLFSLPFTIIYEEGKKNSHTESWIIIKLVEKTINSWRKKLLKLLIR